MNKILLFAVAAAVFVALQQVDALKCWRCSSDTPNAKFCNDPFDETSLTEEQRRWAYVDCSFPYGHNSGFLRTACKKLIQNITGQIEISRSCTWESTDSKPDDCMNGYTPSYIQTLSCKTCTEDGCNAN